MSDRDLLELFEKPKTEDETITVPIEQIEVSDFINPTAEFVESVRRFGIIHPPLVCLKSKGSKKYAVLSGRRRVLAAKAIGLTEIRVQYRKGIYYADALASVLTLEAQQKSYPNPVAEFKAVESLVHEGYTESQISQTLGISPERIKYLLSYGKVPEDVLDGVTAGKVAVSTLESMTRLSKPFLAKAVEEFRSKGALTGPDVQEVKNVRRGEESQRIMKEVTAASNLFVSPPKSSANVQIEVTKAAVKHMAELTSLDSEAAELELQTIIGLLKIRSV